MAIDEEYDDILEDISMECNKFGKVLSVVLPRPKQGMPIEEWRGHGKAFIKYSTVEEAREARRVSFIYNYYWRVLGRAAVHQPHNGMLLPKRKQV